MNRSAEIFAGCWLSVAAAAATCVADDLVLVENGQPRAAIFVPARVLDDAAKNPEPATVWRSLRAEDNRRRLRESVADFAAIVERISGAKLAIVAGPPPAGDARVPILVGELAAERFGKPQKSFSYEQGFRLVVNKDGVGLAGESDLGSSYAIYTLLDQLGCRWFMPSPLGEVLPATKTIAVRPQDVSTGPATIYRGVWYCDNDYARRNRLGGMELSAGHALEFTVPKELRQQHPEIRAIIGGKPHDHFVKWTHPLVAKAISDALLAQLEKDPQIKTFSLSPDDGATWDESDDTKFDAGDFDTTTQSVAKSDRLMVLANRVAETISPKYPHVKFGLLAYVDYTRPPVREKPHASIVPQIAPITFSRAHPMHDDGEPNNKALRGLVEGWGRTVPATSYYFYGFYLAEVSSPNPMVTKWGHDIPFIYAKGKCQYWQPETLSNFETSMHALYLGLRMAWDTTQKPDDIIADFRATMGQLKCASSERLLRLGVSMAQLHIMYTVQRSGELTMSHLAEVMNVSLSNATGLIDRMEERGFIERHRVPTDRRIVLVQVTPAGEQMLGEVDALTDDLLRSVLGRLPISQLRGVAHAISALREAVDSTVGPAPERHSASQHGRDH